MLITGPKSCGKTETAKQYAKSIVEVDRDVQIPTLMGIDPRLILQGETPRLLDEWQIQPRLWYTVRHEVDERKKKGQFILTGSANPEEEAYLHSGAGRFTTVEMGTMTWQEMGYASGKISLGQILEGSDISYMVERLELDWIIDRMIKGGWPALIDQTVDEAVILNRSYIDLLSNIDMSRVSSVKRDPQKVRSLLRSLARNISTIVEEVTLVNDIKKSEDVDISRPTISDYLDALGRLMIYQEQLAFNTHIRSSNSLRKSPKRHYCDVSLAVAALRITKNTLLNDLKYCGFLFESLVFHELKVYARANDAEIFHYRDSTNLEIDAIIQKNGGGWAAFEVKLGNGMYEEAAKNLLKLKSVVDTEKTSLPVSLNIVTGDGMSYTRPDGINVISLASLGK
jgi:hypothetical protein